MDCGQLELTAGAKLGLCKRLNVRVRPGPTGPCAHCRHGANKTPPGPGEFVSGLMDVIPARVPTEPPAVCPRRGPDTGALRECPTCGNRRVKLRVFACPDHPEGVTYQDCGRCPCPQS